MRENCLIFGKVADFSIQQDFARPITKEEAKEIAKKAEEDSLVHKIFHTKMDLDRGVDGICSCCPCCCGLFQLYYRGALPLHTHTSYLSRVEEEECIGCGSCVEVCPTEAITLPGDLAIVSDEKCIGCGVCVKACPSDAIELVRTGAREVFIPPKRVKNIQ